jgi:hypothetical protein
MAENAPDTKPPQPADPNAWRSQQALTPAQLEAARRVMRAHSERLAARWRNGQVDGAERPIEH